MASALCIEENMFQAFSKSNVSGHVLKLPSVLKFAPLASDKKKKCFFEN